MLHEGGATIDAQLAWVFRRATGRHVDPRELAILRQLYDEQREFFAADITAAEKLSGLGEATSNSALRVVDRAASVVVAQALLNFDEVIMSR